MTTLAPGLAITRLCALCQEDDHAWLSQLTSTDQMQIHLARAFISNPHVLVPWALWMEGCERFVQHGAGGENRKWAVRSVKTCVLSAPIAIAWGRNTLFRRLVTLSQVVSRYVFIFRWCPDHIFVVVFR